MSPGRMSAVFALVLVSSACVPPAHAEPSYLAGGYFIGGFPTGDWGEVAGFALAVDGTNITYPKPEKPFAIRSSLGLLYNFSRTEEVPQSNLGPNSQLDLETKNWTVFFGVGPELGKRTGDVSPFVFGTAGFNTYWTSSTLSGTAGGSPYSAEHGDSRIAFAWAAGLGVRRTASDGETVELSAEYRSGGGHEFVLPGEVTSSGTAVTANRDSRTTDQILVRLGVVLGY